MAKFFIVSNQPLKNTIISTFSRLGVRNFASIHQNVNQEIQVNSMKLLNLSGTTQNVLYMIQQPNYDVKEDKMIYFLKSFAESQNISLKFIKASTETIFLRFITGMFLSIHKKLPHDLSPQLVSYEQTGYCALIPNPHDDQEEHSVPPILKIYTVLSMTAMFLVMISYIVVWRLYKNFGAILRPFQLLSFFSKLFYGQTIVNLRRENRIVLLILMEVMLISGLFFSILYQSMITSVLIEPYGKALLKTAEDLEKSSYPMSITIEFWSYLNSSKLFPGINQRVVGNTSTERAIKRGHVFITPCESSELKLHNKIYSKHLNVNLDDFYLLNDIFYSYFRLYDVGIISPYLERLQNYMDWSFSMGITKYWDFLYSLELEKKYGRQVVEKVEEKSFLGFLELSTRFIYHIYFCLVALSVFFGELLWFNVMKVIRARRERKRVQVAWEKLRLEQLKRLKRRNLKTLRTYPVPYLD